MLSSPQQKVLLSGMKDFELIAEEEGKSVLLDEGVDELNIAEFPLAVFSQRPKGSEVVYKNQVYCKHTRKHIDRSLTISVGSSFKLPTPFDSNVILGLLQFYERIDEDKYQEITLREIASVLGLDTGGKTLARIKASINLWFEIGLKYENAWFNARDKVWQNARFNIIDAVIDDDEKYKVRWGKEFLDSLESNYVRPLNLELFRALGNPLAQTLFRYLDKKFYRQNKLDYDLENLAFNHLGIPASTAIADIKRRLKPALEILESTSFFTRDSARYYKQKRRWRIRFQKKEDEVPGDEQVDLFSPVEEVKPLTKRLLSLNLSDAQIDDLYQKFDDERIERGVEISLFFKAQNPRKIRSFIPYLLKVIDNDTQYPEGFVTEKQRQENELARTAKQRQEQETELARKQAAELEFEETRRKVDAYLDSLGEEEAEKFISSVNFVMGQRRGSMIWYGELEMAIEKDE